MRGRIERIWEKRTRNGGRYWVISVNGRRYILWNKRLLEGLSAGDIVELSWAGSGKFKNINKIIKLSEDENKIKQIIRMSCLRSAVELLSRTKEPKLEEVLRIAAIFEEYVLNSNVRSS